MSCFRQTGSVYRLRVVPLRRVFLQIILRLHFSDRFDQARSARHPCAEKSLQFLTGQRASQKLEPQITLVFASTLVVIVQRHISLFYTYTSGQAFDENFHYLGAVLPYMLSVCGVCVCVCVCVCVRERSANQNLIRRFVAQRSVFRNLVATIMPLNRQHTHTHTHSSINQYYMILSTSIPLMSPSCVMDYEHFSILPTRCLFAAYSLPIRCPFTPIH